MEKAILKTLVYSDIFDYPLKSWEIHKWLIDKSCSLKDLEKPLKSLIKEKLVNEHHGYYFLSGRKSIVSKREKRIHDSKLLYLKASIISQILKLIPWIKLVGISGSLSMQNASSKDDIDLFIVTSIGRVWISRIIILVILSVLGLRRKKREKKDNVAGKICINIILDMGSLYQQKGNIYLAHEVLQMRPLWQRDQVYSKYLQDNEWVFKYLPNWIDKSIVRQTSKDVSQKNSQNNQLINTLDQWLGNLQKNYMGVPKGREKISDKALYFHPDDYSVTVLDKYSKGLKKLKI